jgi:hypothetical protein
MRFFREHAAHSRRAASGRGDVGGSFYAGGMEITFCPECGDEIMNTGLAFWPGSDEPVAVIACQGIDCGWVGVGFEQLIERSPMERSLVGAAASVA